MKKPPPNLIPPKSVNAPRSPPDVLRSHYVAMFDFVRSVRKRSGGASPRLASDTIYNHHLTRESEPI